MKLKDFIKACAEDTVVFVMDSSKTNQCLFVVNCSPTTNPCAVLRKKAPASYNNALVKTIVAKGTGVINAYIDIGGIT